MQTCTPHLRASRLIADPSVIGAPQENHCRTLTLGLLDGVELVYWRGRCDQPLELPLLDDSDCIFFSFNCYIQGHASCLFNDERHSEYLIESGTGNIGYGPGRSGRYWQHGIVENLSVMVRPDVLSTWLAPSDTGLSKELDTDSFFFTGYRGGEMQATAKCLADTLANTHEHCPQRGSRHFLWFQGQGVTLLGLFLEAMESADSRPARAAGDTRLLRARDRLLSDLSQAPSLAELAREAAMSEPTLTRGFRRLFDASPYQLFQQERMKCARVRLLHERTPVGVIAADAGYSNPSHFAAAFRKQFGNLPSELRRSIRDR